MKLLPKTMLIAAALIAAYPVFAQTTGAPGVSGASAHTTTTTASSTNDWDSQNTYWHDNYASRPYYNSSRDYSTVEPAYHYGVDLYHHSQGKSYDQLDQSQLKQGWTSARGSSNLDWEDVELATHDAYNRMSQKPANNMVPAE